MRYPLCSLSRLLVSLLLAFALHACTNNPYRSEEAGRNIYYSTFSGEPKHLDPARAYSSDEYRFMSQIYEPIVQYHYLKRPYTLVPLTAVAVPEPKLYDTEGSALSPDSPSEEIAKVVYAVTLRPDIRYQDHPSGTPGVSAVDG